MAPYRKAIIAAVAGVVAVVYAIAMNDDPDSIPGSAETIQGVLTTILVYLIPNSKVSQ